MSKLSRRRFVTAAGASLFVAAVNPVRPVYATEIPADGLILTRLDVRNEAGALIADVYATNATDEGLVYDERSVFFGLQLLDTDGTARDVVFSLDLDLEDMELLTTRIVRPSYVSLAPGVEMHMGTLRPIIPTDARPDALLIGTMTLHTPSADSIAVELPATPIPRT